MVLERVASLSTSMFNIEKAKASQNYGKSLYFDACIVCATLQEAETTMNIISLYSGILFNKPLIFNKNEYYYANIPKGNSEKLSLHISWLPNYGPTGVAPHLQSIISIFKPRFIALAGVCAGDKKKTKLGDLVIAKSAFFYDDENHARKINENNLQTDLYPTNVDIDYILSSINTWHNYITLYESLTNKLSLREDNLLPDTSFYPEFHISPMASTTTVRRDNPFDKVQTLVPKTVAIDMEGAAFYRAISEFPEINSLVVKGICDFADNDKDDTYRFYAASTAAIYILSFIKENFTSHAIH